MLASFLRDKKEVYAWWKCQQIDYYYFSDLPCSFNLRKPFLKNKCIVQIRRKVPFFHRDDYCLLY